MSAAHEWFQHIELEARQQCPGQLERRVLGRGADEDQGAVLDIGQEGVLLALVEAMHLVDEQYRVPPLGSTRALGALDRRADVFDPGEHRRKVQKQGVGVVRDEAGERGLTAPGRAPQHHRMGPPGLDGEAQRPCRPQDVPLPDDVLDAGRPHALGQGFGAAGVRAVRGAHVGVGSMRGGLGGCERSW